MNTKEEVLEFLKNNKTLLKDTYHIQKIGLFGSFARGEQKEQSDVDLLIEIEEGVSDIYDLKESLRDYLSEAFHRSVDLARLKYLKPYAKEEILRDTLYV